MEPLRSQSRLDILVGSMMAGKTSALIRKLTILAEMGLSALYINHGIDNRSDANYSTHSPLLKNQDLNITTMKTTDLSCIATSDISQFDVIGIDEAQFFDESLIHFVHDMVDNHKKYVLVVGLDGDFKRQKFGHILDLIPFADNVAKLHAFCKRCASERKVLVNALFTHYTAAEQFSDDSIKVGGAEKYEAVCRECYLALQD